MSDLLHLLWILAAIYGLECLIWLRLGGIAVVSWTGTRWRIRHPGQSWGNTRGGIVVAHPLPPLGLCLCAAQWPLSLSPLGACAYNPGVLNRNRRPPYSAAHVRFAEVKHFRHMGRHIWVNGRKWCPAASEAQAAWLAKKLEHLRQMPVEKRAAEIQALLEETLNGAGLMERRVQWQKEASFLRWQANALFASTFLISPAIVALRGIKETWWMIVLLLVSQMFYVTWSFFRAHKRLLPEASEDRFNWTLTMALALPAAMRAHDLLGRQAFDRFHPAALAKTFCSEDDARDFAAMVLRDLRYPLHFPPPGLGQEARDILLCHQKTWSQVVAEWIKQAGWKESELLAAPRKADPAESFYCARCQALYTMSKDECNECGCASLLPLK